MITERQAIALSALAFLAVCVGVTARRIWVLLA